ncbi:beta-N-acetylglucosaminidase domain-containing protein [Paenarthrobacter sp. NPDC092416]|uniref:beta-N-acetylhexosaminidase family protein n=1 Tax=Paenarthrobacter sp. NPDC092416 TaxID=3364386 RepID=UPI00380E0E61
MTSQPVRGRSKRRRSVLLLMAAAVLVAVLVVAAWLVASGNGRSGGGQSGDGGRVEGVPDIFPVPQHVRPSGGGSVPLKGRVYVVAAPGTDQPSVSAVQDLVADAGGTTEVVSTLAEPEPGSSAIFLGVAASGSSVSALLAEFGQRDAAENKQALGHPGGYVLATGTTQGVPAAVLAGRDDDGVFHAVQTLRQLLKDGSVAAATISDWPLMEARGVIEGFYGTPWSHQARLDVLEFAGRQKMNTYVYSPKDDPLLRDRWRSLYSDQQLELLKEVIDTATANHIRFSYALSPGIDICYSREADLEDTVTKLESLYDLGVRSFVIPLDDIATKVQCSDDVREFGSGQANLARAQASYLNDVNQRFIAGRPDIQPLETVPTFYDGSEGNPYKRALGAGLHPDIVVQWTGEDVVSHRITRESAEAARRTYGSSGNPRDILIWDNYPVNDFSQDHLFMAPVIGRDSALHDAIRGIVTNPMIEPYLSFPAIFNYADLAWNGPAYDPKASMHAALSQIAGPDPDVQAAVRAFVDLNQEWQDDELTPSAPELRRDIDQFWAEYDAGKSPTGGLKARAELLQRLPELLPRMEVAGFSKDATHWASAAARYGRGVEDALSMLDAAKRGDAKAATEARTKVEAAMTDAAARTQPTLAYGVVTPILGDSELKTFLERALKTVDSGK